MAGIVGFMIGIGLGCGVGLLIGLVGFFLIVLILIVMFNFFIKWLEVCLFNYGFINE